LNWLVIILASQNAPKRHYEYLKNFPISHTTRRLKPHTLDTILDPPLLYSMLHHHGTLPMTTMIFSKIKVQ